MKLAVLGFPGAGKGSQAKLLSETLSIPRICPGEMLRALSREKSPLGKRVKVMIEKGELVPDNLVLALLRQRLGESDAQRGFILDGTPRTLNQAQMFRKLFSLDKVFVLKIDEKTAMARLLKRGREDDTPEAIGRRFKIFNREIDQIVKLYHGLSILVEIDANATPQVVHKRTLSQLKRD